MCTRRFPAMGSSPHGPPSHASRDYGETLLAQPRGQAGDFKQLTHEPGLKGSLYSAVYLRT
jgi:hypothetical protein